MTCGRQLKGRRIAVLAADGFEKVELSVPVAALRAEGADVDIVSLRPGRIRGVNLHEPASRVSVDRTLSEAKVATTRRSFRAASSTPTGCASPSPRASLCASSTRAASRLPRCVTGRGCCRPPA